MKRSIIAYPILTLLAGSDKQLEKPVHSEKRLQLAKPAEGFIIAIPESKSLVMLELLDGNRHWSVKFRGKLILKKSGLGLVLGTDDLKGLFNDRVSQNGSS